MITLTLRNPHQDAQTTTCDTKGEALRVKDRLVGAMMTMAAGTYRCSVCGVLRPAASHRGLHPANWREDADRPQVDYNTRERDHGFEWNAGGYALRMVDLDEAVGQLVEAFGLVDPARRDPASTPTGAAEFIRSYAAKEWGIADLETVDNVIPDFVPMGCDDHFPDTCRECGSD